MTTPSSILLYSACNANDLKKDVPCSNRPARADLSEMLDCALEALNACWITKPIDVIGHSMSSLCALAFAIEHPERVRRLALVGSMSGFPAVRRWSIPHKPDAPAAGQPAPDGASQPAFQGITDLRTGAAARQAGMPASSQVIQEITKRIDDAINLR